MTPPDPPGVVVIHIRPVADPQARDGRPGRAPLYRLRGLLRVMLRGFGWKVCDMHELHPAPVVWPGGEGI